ncbi:transglycosylase domain-containing protein [Pseudarthrobacter sp. J1763]|uniref:transglycosylase domain-containing protein n=1 Tax=Pseudarthrobacter sp. J1763 TaxID=3420445 RepID=UPI003D26CEDF
MAQRKNPLFDTATVLGKIIAFLGVSAVCGVLVAGLLVPAAAVTGSSASGSIQFFDTLPSELTVDPPGQVTKILAADNSQIASLYSENRTKVDLKNMSPFVKNAVIAIEDNRFYEHGGVDTTGILRALVSTAQGKKQGASTITQQYVNNVINESLVAEGKTDQVLLNGVNKGVGDKLREMKLAIALEKKMTKDQILEGYLNIVFFNSNAYGIEAASKYFFSTTAKDLTLPQAALLAGLVNNPSGYDPISNPKSAKVRRDLVLAAMLRYGKIDKAAYDAAVKTPVTTKVTQPRQGCAYASQAQYFCAYVLHTILNNPAYGATQEDRVKKVYSGGLTIKTTLDPRLQSPAQAQADAIAGSNPDKWGASLITVQPGTGKILSMAQNTRMLAGQSSFATTYNFNVDRKDANGNDLGGAGGFQPGSTMKPVTFSAWLKEGKALNTVVPAYNRVYPLDYPWKTTCQAVTGAFNDAEEYLGAAPTLQNNDEGYYRNMPVNYGLYNSINTATYASAAMLDDFCDIQRMADALKMHNGEGKDKLDMSTLSSLLGPYNVSPLTMASAFATFSAEGTYCEPMAVTSVTDAQGKALPAQTQNCQKDAISPDVAKGVNYVLQDVLKQGSGWQMPKVGAPAAAKTGTNNYNSQTWVVGYTKGLATAAYFGEALEDPSQRLGRDVTINGKFYPVVDGSQIAGVMWGQYMQQVAGLYNTSEFAEPPANLLSAPQPVQRDPVPQPTQSSTGGSNSTTPETTAPSSQPTTSTTANNNGKKKNG